MFNVLKILWQLTLIAKEMRAIIKMQLSILDPDEFGGKTVPDLTITDIEDF